MEKQTISKELKKNVMYLSNVLPVEQSFDIIQRNMVIGGRDSAFYFIDGFTKDEAMLKIMDSFFGVQAEDMPADATSFAERYVPYVEVDILGDFNDILKNIFQKTT